MKNLLLLSLLLLGLNVHAQYGVGLGVVAASASGVNFEDQNIRVGFGGQLKALYRINTKIALEANAMYFRNTSDAVEATESGVLFFEEFNALQFNLNAQFNIIDNIYNRAYAFVGPSFGKFGIANHAGVNAGFGVEQKSGIYTDFTVQYRQWYGDFTFEDKQIQFMVTLGYMYNFGQPKEKYRKGYEEPEL